MKRARLTTTMSGTEHHNVLVIPFNDRSGWEVRSLLHTLVVDVTSDNTSDDGATTIRRLTDRIGLVCLSENVAWAPISAINNNRDSSPVGVGDVGATIYIMLAQLLSTE